MRSQGSPGVFVRTTEQMARSTALSTIQSAIRSSVGIASVGVGSVLLFNGEEITYLGTQITFRILRHRDPK